MANSRVCVLLGASGLLGRNLMRDWRDVAIDIIAVSRSPLSSFSGYDPGPRVKYRDASAWKQGALDLIEAGHEVFVVNGAALADIGACERDPHAALSANRDFVEDSARFCRDHSIPFIHISTDGLFSNDDLAIAPRYFSLNDPPKPVTRYGESKLQAEQVLRELNWGQCLRMSFVCESLGTGRGLIAFLAKQLRTPEMEVPGFTDNWFTPVHAAQFSSRLKDLVIGQNAAGFGLHHWCCHPAITKHDFLERVARLAGFKPKMVPKRRADFLVSSPAPLDQSLASEHPFSLEEMIALSAQSLLKELNP